MQFVLLWRPACGGYLCWAGICAEGKHAKMQKSMIENKEPVLYGLLKKSDYEMGFESKAERYFNELYRKYEANWWRAADFRRNS